MIQDRTATTPQPELPYKAGDVLLLAADAGIQFAATPVFVKYIRLTPDRPSSTEGCAWIDVYQLDNAGDATDRRCLFVLVAGVRLIDMTSNQRG